MEVSNLLTGFSTFGQEEIVFNNFEELHEFTEKVLSRMGVVIED